MSFVRLLRVVFSVGAAALIGSLAVPARAATTTYDTNDTPYAGGTIDPGDTVLLNDGATVTGNVTANGTLQFNQSETTLTISNVISGTGTLLLTNAGTLNLTRLCALVYLSQDVGLVLGFKRSPHGLLQQRRIRSLLPVATACSWPTPSRPFGGRGGGRSSRRAKPSFRSAHHCLLCTQHPLVLHLMSSGPSALIGEKAGVSPIIGTEGSLAGYGPVLVGGIE